MVHDPSVERREFKRENVAPQDKDSKLNINEPVSKYCIPKVGTFVFGERHLILG